MSPMFTQDVVVQWGSQVVDVFVVLAEELGSNISMGGY